MRALRESYLADPRVQALAEACAADRELVLGSCHGGIIPLLIAAWSAGAQRPRLVVHPEPKALCEDLEELGVACAELVELDRWAEGEEQSDADRAALTRRTAALEAFAAGALLVSSPAAAAQPVPDLAEVAKQGIVLRPGEEHELQALTERLLANGYRVAGVVEARGELAVRGGILDVYPFIGADPLRLEFFGDTLETVRRFDAFSQESISKVEEAVLASARIGLATRSLWGELPEGPIAVVGDLPLRQRLPKDHGRREIRLARQLESGAHDAASLGVERLRGDLRHGLAGLKAMLGETPGTRALLLARSEEAAHELRKHCADAGLDAELRIGRISAGFRDLERGLAVVHDFELAERMATRRRSGRVAQGSPLSSLEDLRNGDHVVHLRHGVGVFRGMATLEKRGFLEDFLLLEFAEGTKIYVPVDAIDMVQKYVSASGRAPVLDRIGGAAWAKRKARAEKAVEDISSELLASQARRIAAGGFACPPDSPEQRRFEAAFPFEETEDQLAATREIKADLERPVAMDRLLCGDVGFGKTEVAMRAVAKTALAGRQVAVLAPTTLLAEQHLETFTERFAGLPIRVAGLTRFRAGKERRELLAKVAAGEIEVLIGTHAILSESLVFRELGLLVVDEEHRFGVKQKERLRALRGVGTPAPPAEGDEAEAAPRNLAAKPPDVLSLSATPIPRTLHFSMLGLRDISVLAEPPAARLSVETRVAPWDDELVKHALQRELERQGQVFVVHNRVQDLDHVAGRFVHLCPGLKTETIHGQMDPERIARVMEAFRHRRLDVLVATSIVESGIDVPNANTLFVNNAHCFGLAELHQLRGRIGRFTQQAYAYFLTPPHTEIGEEARERLAAIQEYAELGAGFKLAMRDLEIRGAGNLLGAEQSGHIDAIGYELYARLLGEAVARTRGEPGAKPSLRGEAKPEAFLNLPVDAYIPDTWLETPQLKFELHRNLDRCRSLKALADIARNARDRFGALPAEVARIFQVRALRLRARQLGISRIDVGERQLRLHLVAGLPKELAAVKLPEVVHVQIDGPVLVLFVRSVAGQDAWLALLARLTGLDLAWLGRAT